MKVKITRDCVISKDQTGVRDEIVDVSEDKARELAQANACDEAPEDAKVGKPSKK